MQYNFLLLHDSDTNTTISQNVDNIVVFYLNDNHNTTVYLENKNIDEISVNESPEKIMQLISKSFKNNPVSFVQLHDGDTNATLCVNFKYICTMYSTEVYNKDAEDKANGNTIIQFNSEHTDYISVNETTEKVHDMILKALQPTTKKQ